MVFDKLKKALIGSGNVAGDEYIEIDLNQEKRDKKVLIRLFSLKQYEEVNDILNSLREGYTIAVIDIKTLRQKDSIELKRSVAKIKKTVDAIGGNIAGFGENTVIVTPPFAKIHKEAERIPREGMPANKFM